MTLYVEVNKTLEEENCVYYDYQYAIPTESFLNKAGKQRYKARKTVTGKLKIDKKTGDVYTLEFAEGDTGVYAKRASWALIKHWCKGEFPEKTYWAS